MKKLFFAMMLSVSMFCMEFTGSGEGQFFGTSTLHDFSGKVPFSEVVARTDDKGGMEIKIIFDVKNMKTGDGKRDSGMYSMFESKKFPQIFGDISNFPLEKGLSSSVVNWPVNLKIREETRVVEAKINQMKKLEGKYQIEVEFPVSLSNFKLKAPRAMFGMIRVKDIVNVKASIILEEKK